MATKTTPEKKIARPDPRRSFDGIVLTLYVFHERDRR
jgi:hypothetical protein